MNGPDTPLPAPLRPLGLSNGTSMLFTVSPISPGKISMHCNGPTNPLAPHDLTALARRFLEIHDWMIGDGG